MGPGDLPSVELGFSEVIVLPTTLPDGTPLIDSTVADTRAGTLEALGIG